jgi:hypothetical protein
MAITDIDTSFVTFASGCQALIRLGTGAEAIAVVLQNYCSEAESPIFTL